MWPEMYTQRLPENRLSLWVTERGPWLAKLLTSWEGPEVRWGDGAGSHPPWEDLCRSDGRIPLLLGDSVKRDRFKFRDPGTPDSYQNKAELS